MYEIKISSAAKKDIKALPRQVQKELAKHLDILVSNPNTGEQLKGVLRGFWKYAFIVRSTDYRIVYQISAKEAIILLIMVGARENFYDRLNRRV